MSFDQINLSQPLMGTVLMPGEQGKPGPPGEKGDPGQKGDPGPAGLGTWTTGYPISNVDTSAVTVNAVPGRSPQVGDLVLSANVATEGALGSVVSVQSPLAVTVLYVMTVAGPPGQPGGPGEQGPPGPPGVLKYLEAKLAAAWTMPTTLTAVPGWSITVPSQATDLRVFANVLSRISTPTAATTQVRSQFILNGVAENFPLNMPTPYTTTYGGPMVGTGRLPILLPANQANTIAVQMMLTAALAGTTLDSGSTFWIEY